VLWREVGAARAAASVPVITTDEMPGLFERQLLKLALRAGLAAATTPVDELGFRVSAGACRE
jgi:hypothetical protein